MTNLLRRRAGVTNAGFTIVELLVVISIIGVLVGLLLPALGGVQRRSKKADEISRIRQVGVAWNLYANANQDRALPGWLEDDVQSRWRVSYRFPDDKVIPDADSEEWSWRLMPYLDHDQETLMGHLNLPETSKVALSNYAPSEYDPAFVYPPPRPQRPALARARHIAQEPGFGYNAMYVGGWWEMVDVEGEELPRHRFYNARELNPSDPDADGRINPVALTPGSIRDSSRFILFCSTAGQSMGSHHEVKDIWPGSHYAVPPIVADSRIWETASADSIIDVVQLLDSFSSPIPVGRFTGQAAVLHADLHSEPWAPGDLDDQRYWINLADNETWKHRPE
ncbi:MAG: type II secretion system protein [Phycisphaerales bacterium]|nr:type II secretion system GspH family protein [Phycisphaerae bacterium]NNF44677.1 type II secretion system protein [Phycisphaerales bacterium]NNM27835.1 type II secretion system protein [Phycisphaerales bacterium]